MEYKIIESAHKSIVEEKVNEHIQNGWEPLGGISVATNSHWYAQAIIKKEHGA